MNPVRQQPAKRIHRQCALETDHALRFVALVCAPQTELHQPLESQMFKGSLHKQRV